MPPRPRIAALDSSVLQSASSGSVCSPCLRSAPKPRLTRSLSSTPTPQASRMRRQFYGWLNGPGSAFKDPLPGSTNYLNAYNSAGQLIRGNREDTGEGDQGESGDGIVRGENRGGLPRESREDLMPFPENKLFVSQSVLSEEHKDAIWTMVREEGKSVREVSNLLGVSMDRVGAVVRLKGVEKDWVEKGQPLANFYSKAIHGMVPVTPYRPPFDGELIAQRAHESINDLNVHKSTKEQIFFPASESRQFTRVDAGSVFEKGLLPADKRIPHPEAIEFHRFRATQTQRDIAAERLSKFYGQEVRQRKRARDIKAATLKRNTTRIEGDRAIFQITNIAVDEHTVGKDGRGVRGVGVRYGLPHQDRKKGQIKIPTSVR